MQNKPSAISSDEEFMQALALLLNFIESEDQTDEPNDPLAELVARRRLQDYLADPSIGIPYEDFHRRMVAEGVLDA